MSAVVFGGYGTFGRRVCRNLVEQDIPVVVAGRDAVRAAALATELRAHHSTATAEPLAADVNDRAACDAALRATAQLGARPQVERVAINCAGPFRALTPTLVDACLAAGVHYVDIADDREWCAALFARDAEFRAKNLVCVPGASSLPGLSTALAKIARDNCPGAPFLARISLFIGNDNPKGEAAVRSAAAIAGRPIRAPQGELRGFSLPEAVDLPAPFGRRTVRNFDSADYDLLPRLVPGLREVRVKVGFESRPGNFLFGLLGRLPASLTPLTASALARAGRLAPRLGHSGGVVMAELFGKSFSATAALHSPTNGQEMAALPAAFAAQAILEGAPARGVLTAPELLGPDALLTRVTTRGFTLTRS